MNTLKELAEVRFYDPSELVQREVLRRIYRTALIKDKMFWFLPEGEYIVIRCSKKFVPAIKKIQSDLEKELLTGRFEYSGWIENSDDVMEHADAFTKIMHECSVIALEDNYRPFELFERITHCIFLEFRERIENEYPSCNKRTLEPTVLTNLAIGRAEIEGFCQGKRYSELTEKGSLGENPTL